MLNPGLHRRLLCYASSYSTCSKWESEKWNDAETWAKILVKRLLSLSFTLISSHTLTLTSYRYIYRGRGWIEEQQPFYGDGEETARLYHLANFSSLSLMYVFMICVVSIVRFLFVFYPVDNIAVFFFLVSIF